ncbi:MAG: glycoside hydrolase family 2, partial [Candidatus Latescibacteria bacterium]|nr:glycoside hydrolase family 2 [Candidatus Latescibacterota bacterium]
MTSDWSSSELDLSRHDVPRPEYPRPDFQRGTVEGLDWINLNGLWDFEFDPDNIGVGQGWYKNDDRLTQSIVVPFAWESHLAWDEGHLASNDNWFSKHAFRQPEKVNHANYRDQERHEIGWYGTMVDIPTHWTSKQVILHFCASDWETRVWVNGRFAGTHEGGYDAFSFDVTAFCTSSETAHIVVRVYDPNDHRAQPGGKQINWYARTSGLWQAVYLEPRPRQYIRCVHITPDIDTGKAVFDVDADHTDQAQIHIVTKAPDGSELQTDGISNGAPFELSIPDPICWSPETPHLYEVAVELIVDGKTVDRVRTYFGMRKVSVDVLPGTDTRYIFLNNKPVYLCGALNQSFNPWGIYTFPSDESIQKDLQRALDFGFNFLRLHIKIEEPRFLYWADRMGVLLMCDIPNFDHPGYGAEAQERWEATMRA